MTRLKLRHVHAFVDRHGRVRHYFRRRGAKQVPLPGLPGSAEFMAAYQAALAGMTAPAVEIGANRTKPGTVDAAVVGYYQRLTFRELAPSTQRMRRQIIERFRVEHGAKQISTLPTRFLVLMLSRMKPAAARNCLKALRGLLDFAVAEGFRADNPAADIKLAPYRSDGHATWSEEHIARFEAHYAIGTKPRLAFALLLDTAQRRGDVIRMGPQHVRDGAIHIKQAKTGKALAIPIYPSLQVVLDATPCAALTFLTTRTGRPYSGSDFSDEFRKWCDAAALPKSCTAHGLRKTAACRLVNDGATTHQIAAMTGHASLSEVQRYTKAADQARLAREAVALRQRRAEQTKSESEVANLSRRFANGSKKL